MKLTRFIVIAFSLALVSLSACTTPSPTPTPNPDPDPKPSSKFELSLEPDKIIIFQGGTANVTVNLKRNAGFTGAVNVALSNLPTGVTASSATVAADATSAEIQLSAPDSAPHSLPTAVTAKGTSGLENASQTFTVTVRGEAGELDTSFSGGANIVPVGPIDDYAEAMAVQSDGKVVVVGRGYMTGGGIGIALVRFNRDGGLDTTFGTGGKVMTKLGTGETANDIAVQPDGKILVAGYTTSASGIDFVLLRYNTDGSLDKTFDGDGNVITAMTSDTDRANALLVQPDGKILVGGEARFVDSGIDFALARYNTNGSLDTSFDSDGKTFTAIGALGQSDAINALALQTVEGENRIVAVGGEGTFVLARYKANGELDSSFGTNGTVNNLYVSTIGKANAVSVLSDGKLLVAGQIMNDFALARLTANGELDSSFENGGAVITKLSSTNWDVAESMVVQADGKIVLGGWMYDAGSQGDFALVRYNENGSLDTGFGNAGQTITSVASGTKNDQGNEVALQVDERVPTTRVLLAGSVSVSGHDFGLLRFWQ